MHGANREEGSARVITYDPHGDEMTIFVHITSERLEKDIDYRLSYRRVPAEAPPAEASEE